MPINNESLPNDDIQNGDMSEDALLDAVLSQSQFIDNDEDVPLPEEQELIDDAVEPVEEDPETDDIDTEEEIEELEDEESDEDAELDDATQDVDVYTADDLDLEAMVRVKIDGEELDVSFADLLKGYQTDASLSKKGRELGEAKKQLEVERDEKLQEVMAFGEASAAVLMKDEAAFAKQYHDIEQKIATAREEQDSYALSELKDERELVQGKYWKARKERENLQEKLQSQKQEQMEKAHQEQLQYFYDNIENEIPGWNQDIAVAVRDFAIEEGIPEQVVDSISDPLVVRVLNDYRTLKQSVTKGSAKRKAAPQKKAVPAKKGKTSAQKKTDKAKMTKARAFKDDASSEDQMAFLRDYAAKSLGI